MLSAVALERTTSRARYPLGTGGPLRAATTSGSSFPEAVVSACGLLGSTPVTDIGKCSVFANFPQKIPSSRDLMNHTRDAYAANARGSCDLDWCFHRSPFFSGKTETKFLRKIRLVLENANEWVGVGTAESSIKARSVLVLEPRVSTNKRFRVGDTP